MIFRFFGHGRVAVSLLLSTLFFSHSVFSQIPDTWRVDLETPIIFQRILTPDLLLVGTERHLFAVEIRDGRIEWRLRNVAVRAEQTMRVPGSNILLINEGWGGDFKDRQSSVLAVNIQNGEILWESPTVRDRQVLSIIHEPELGRLLAVTAEEPHGKGGEKRRLRLHLYDYQTGKTLWEAELDNKIKLAPILNPREEDHKYQSYDLSAYHEPVFYQNRIFTLYDGIRCYDGQTGKLLWRQKFDVVEDDLLKSSAEPLFDGDTIYFAAKGRVRALDSRTGRELWKSDDYGVLTELYLDGERLYGKLGGFFLEIDDDGWKRKGPYGAVSLDRSNGRKFWKWDDGDDGITNLLILGDRVYLADKNNLFALDRYNGDRVYKESHKFDKPPKFIGLLENEQLVLTGDENVASFRYGDGYRLWFHHLEPPGTSFWKKLASGFLASTGFILAAASYGLALDRGLLPAIPSPLSRVVGYGRVIRLGKSVGGGLMQSSADMLQRTRFAQLDGNHQYFFTKLPQGGKGLLGVNLSNGRTDHSLPLKEGNAELTVQEELAVVYRTEGTELVGYRLNRGDEPSMRRNQHRRF